jgi:hypothetical protein
VLAALAYANKKCSREILKIPDNATKKEVATLCREAGKSLYDYFLRYCGDPASTAYQCNKRHYRQVAEEQHRNRQTQMERMNSGWRYQYIAKDAAGRSRRFESVSDIGTQEADFNVTVRFVEMKGLLSIYVSVKNRTNTMGGQDWPKAIAALEEIAKSDKNREGNYLCIFGMAMEKGQRLIKCRQKTKTPHSFNTEIWKSDFFWPFFTSKSYEEIVAAVLRVLMEKSRPASEISFIPDDLIESFGDSCRKDLLLDDQGIFNDPFRLASIICGVKK